MRVMEEDLSDQRWATLSKHVENLSAIDQVMAKLNEDRVVDLNESVFICTVLPQWTEQVGEAGRYITSLSRSDLQALEVEVALKENLTAELHDSCADTAQMHSTPTVATPTGIPASVPTSDLAAPAAILTSLPVPTPTPDVPMSISSGEVHQDHWYKAADRCNIPDTSEWSDQIWEETTLAYIGAAMLVGIVDTEWSLSPKDLEQYREFLNGTRTFNVEEWSNLFGTHETLEKTLASAMRFRSSGTIMIDDSVIPNFPHDWLARYHVALPRLQDMSSKDGKFTGTIRVPQGGRDQRSRNANPVLDSLLGSLTILKKQFYCQTTELQE